MTPPRYSTDPRAADSPLEARDSGGIPDGSMHAVPREILDPEIFQELRDLLGDEQTRSALEELSSSLEDFFPNMSAEDLDRDQTFNRAHFVVARAGMMGFTAMRDACWKLQHACATGAPFSSEYELAREATMAARGAIVSLL